VQHTVGIAEMKVSANPADTFITHALGSCIGVTVYDPVVHVAGMIHIMLPMSRIDPAKAEARPSMFVDTGIPALFREAYQLGAVKDRVRLKVAGGANIMDANGHFNIGERNYTMLRKLLWKNNVLIAAEDVGGTVSRTVTMEVGTGKVTVRISGESREL